MKCKCIVPHAYAMRIERKWWMWLLPFSAFYHCTHCEAKMLLLGRRAVERPVAGARQSS